MPKFRDYFRQMLAENEQLFADFSEIHNLYQSDRAKWQDEYNQKGAPVLEVILEWERRLCGHSEKGTYAKYSANLAEKFRSEIKAFFPMIDFIGLKVVQPATKTAPSAPKPVETKPSDPDLAEIEVMDLDSFDIPKLF